MLYYMAHPVRPGTSKETMPENITKAVGHLAALNTVGFSVIAPWIGLCRALRDDVPAEHDHRQVVSFAALKRCDGLILCGPRVSEGMEVALVAAKDYGLKIIDVTKSAPWVAADLAWKQA